jgi:hypothetical protein
MKPDTWSNIAYVILGAVWLYQGHIGLGALAILLGATSGYSHHTRDWLPDWAGMYAIFTGIILHGFGYPPSLGFGAFLITFAFPSYLLDRYALIGILWLGAFLLSPSWLVAGLFVSALIIRQIGELKRYQALHSAWHFITAIGFYYLPNA